MSTIRPFPAIRYATTPQHNDVSTRIAPPYDVLDEAGKQALLDPDPKNFVAIDLPHMPPKSAGPQEVYEQSNNTLHAWLQDGTFVRDTEPRIYVYHQHYRYGDSDYVRKMFFARLRIEPFGAGAVFPHERTFGGPKEDRLALTKATRANLSPIFGLYEDAGNAVSQLLEAGLPETPLARGTLDGVESRLWGVADPQRIEQCVKLMKPKPIYIADGHHRYGTALLYRDWLTEQEGPLPAEHPANFVLCVFCAMEDPGLLILPTHRVLPQVSIPESLLADDAKVEVTPMTSDDPDAIVRDLAQFGPQAVAWFDPDRGRCCALRPTAPDLLDTLEPDHSPAWRKLGLAFLHAYLLQRLVTPQVCGGSDPTIQYIKAARDAVETARATGGTAFLMQPTTMEEMRGVCSAGDLMPQKSTFFYPKLASGLIINPLTA